MDSTAVDVNATRPGHRALPDLAKYVGKTVDIKLKDGRHVVGILRGYDNRMNIVVSDWKGISKKAFREGTTDDETVYPQEAVLRGSAIDDVQLMSE